MNRKKAAFLADGVLVLDKKTGLTSYQALARIKRKLMPVRVGHTGTLDPFARGVLVLLFNQATRLANVFGAGLKIYQAQVRLGQATDTGDHTGRVIEERPVGLITPDQAEQAMTAMTGEIMQAPPAYSAAKHQGRPLYSYARAGETVEKPPRRVVVKSAALTGLESGCLHFELACGSGVYVRSWAESLARGLGTVGCLSALARIKNGPFTLEQALSSDEADAMEAEEIKRRVIPVQDALGMLGAAELRVNADMAFILRQGAQPGKKEFFDPPSTGLAYVLDDEGQLVTVLNFHEPGSSGREYETIRVFNLTSAPAV